MGEETPQKDLETIKKQTEKYFNLGGFQLGDIQGNLAKKVLSIFVKNFRKLRLCNSIEMFQVDNSGYFSVPSAPAAYASLNKPINKAITKYPPLFIQNLAFQIKSFYDRPLDFARMIFNYFKQDPSSLIYFSYITFPAIYANFLGLEFIRDASLFLIAFFVETKCQSYSELLIETFFRNTPIFYNRLWISLSNEMTKLPKDPTYDQYFGLLKRSLSHSLSLLTEYHINTFSAYVQQFGVWGGNFLIEKVILKAFENASKSSPYLPHKSINDKLLVFLRELAKETHYKDVGQLVALVRNHKEFLQSSPSMRCTIWSRGIPFFLSERDISLLNTILSGSTLFPLHTPPNLKMGSGSDVFQLDVFPSFAGSDTGTQICEELFSEKPPSVSAAASESYERVWRRIVLLAKTEGVDVFRLVSASGSEGSLLGKQSDGFLKYAYSKIMIQYGENYKALNQNVLLAEHLRFQRNQKESIDNYFLELFHTFAAPFLRRHISMLIPSFVRSSGLLVRRIPATMAAVLQDAPASPQGSFQLACACLDTIAVRQLPAVEAMERRFAAILDGWMESSWAGASGHDDIASRMVQVLNTASMISHIGDLQFGQRLALLILFMRRLSQVLPPHAEDEGWDALFTLAIFTAKSRAVLPTFLFLHHFVFAVPGLPQSFGAAINSMWTLFTAGMWNILKRDTDFWLSCSAEEHIRSLFMDK